MVEYLRYSMRLLHFIREVKLAENPPKRQYFTPDIEGLKAVDPFL